MVLIGPESAVLGLLAPWWAKFGWLSASTVGWFGLRSYSTFFFDKDPLTNDGGPSAISEFPRSAPLWSPTGEDLTVNKLAWVG